MLGKSPSDQAMEVVRPGDLIPDNRLTADAPDLLEHDAIARGVAEIAWSADAPVNIALFGAWGSGKSSVYSMIERHLERVAPKRVRVARYDAWKYGGRELKRNFINSLAHELGLDDKPEFSHGLENEQVETKLETWKWVKKNWRSLVVGVLLAAALATLWILAQAGVVWAFTDHGFKATARVVAIGGGTVFGLALVAALVGPKAFEGAVITNKAAAPEGSDQFAKRFNDLVKAALKGKHERLVVFIDELDRCDPKDVVATLIDLKTFLDQDKCAFIVAADREVIERALRKVPQAKPVREDEPYYATPGAFLDKIFQHQLALPPLRTRALTKFAHDLVDNQGGVWEELRGRDAVGTDTFDRAVFALVPVHVRSPRRVKVLLNNFATNARIASSRGIDWLDRAHEIAVLTVLQTEFPAVADELRRVPRLLAYLRDDAAPSTELRSIVDQYRFNPDEQAKTADAIPLTAQTMVAAMAQAMAQVMVHADGADGDAADAAADTAAGRLLSDDGTTSGVHELEVASHNLRRHLANYLAKVAAAGIRDPRPDLFYLQVAGGREALPDPRLGDVIDLVADTAPDTVVEAFAEQTSATLAVAIPLVVIEGDGEGGPGQQFAYESACRLAENLDPDDRGGVAQQIAPSLIAAANAGTLSDASLPGALLVTCWNNADDADDVVTQVLKRVAGRGPSERLLDGLTVLLPELGKNAQTQLIEMLADRFGNHRQPLLTALREAPVDSAVALWSAASDRVLRVLNELELPEAETAPATATGGTATRSVATPPAQEPTGDGVALLNDIVDVVIERSDHEPLLSAIVATAQSSAAAKPLRDWVAENADQLVGTMSSPARRAKHALVGMDRNRGPYRRTWALTLPEPDVPSAPGTSATAAPGALQVEVTALANELLEALVSAFATAEEAELRTLPDLVVKVAGWGSVIGEDLADIVASTVQSIGWTGGGTEDAAGQAVWDRKERLLSVSAALARPLGSDDQIQVFAPFVTDLAAMLDEFKLTPYAVENWIKLVAQLPTGAAEALAAEVDRHEPVEDETAAVLKMRLAVRLVFGGAAPAASELTDLDQEELTTAIVDAWLTLRPAAAEARQVLTIATCKAAALRAYCDTLDTDDRTDIWLTLRTTNAAEGALRAAGAGGLGVAAVQDVRERIKQAGREPDRADMASQLMAGAPASDVVGAMKKAVSELANDLLDRDTTGDFRTAAELVRWVGGPGHGHMLNLRQKFNGAPEGRRNALPQALRDALVAMTLMTPPPRKKKFRRPKLFGD